MSFDRIILASNSPRRTELLKECMIDFKVIPHEYNEDLIGNEKPEKYAKRLAFGKAESISSKKEYISEYILGADTIVVINNKVLGKPRDESEALSFIKLLSGKKHKVITGISLLNRKKGIFLTKMELSWVEFDRINDDFIKYYLDNKLWRGYAGGYAIQESIFNIVVKKIKGSYSNIVGLPVNLLYKMLKKADFKGRF